MSKKNIISTSRVIAAPASKIFDLLADPHQHSKLDGLGSVVAVAKGPDRLFLGAKFKMKMNRKAKYTTSNVVSAFVENKTIAWHHFSQFVWRYDLEEVSGGTKVTESFDFSKPWGFFIPLIGWDTADLRGMEKTLEILEKVVTA
jgi:hypothetical protein